MKNVELSKAVKIGIACIFAYTVRYYMGNILSVLSPAMLETGRYTKEYLGLLSSVYMVVYAAGQLINGITGDRISPKKMIGGGLFICGTVSMLFVVSDIKIFQLLCFGMLGFSLSMLRGPLMKVISENTLPQYARIICVFFSVLSFVGSFIATLLAMMFEWDMVFIAAGVLALLIAAAAYFTIDNMEKKGHITFKLSEKKGISGIANVFKIDNFIFYMFVGILVEIAASSINFWIPTYLTENLRFEKEAANLVFSAMSLIKAFTPLVALTLLKIFKERDVFIVKSSFLVSAMFFLLMVFVKNAWINVIFFLLARISAACASTMLWSIYIPALGKTGRVSSVNGILDCTGYIGAAVANMIFGLIVDHVRWEGVIYIWAGLMLSGFVAAIVSRARDTKYLTSEE